MTGKAGKPQVWATLLAAFRDASAVVRQAPVLTALTAAFCFADAFLYEAVYARLEKGLPTALLMAADTVVIYAILTPLSVATFRWVLLGERPGLVGLADKLDVLWTFATVSAAIGFVVFAPLMLTEGVEPEDAPVLFLGLFSATLVLVVLSVRLVFLQPSISTRSVLAGFGATWRMTRGVSWRMVGALALLFAPALMLMVAATVSSDEVSPHATATIVGSFNTYFTLVGSAVIARYYAWRFQRG